MSSSIATPADVAAVFGMPGELDSTSIIWNLVRLQEGNGFDEVLLNLFEWVRDVLDSSLTTQTDEERAHLVQSLRLVEAVIAVTLDDDEEEALDDDAQLPLFDGHSSSDEEWRSIPGFYPEATEVELRDGWTLYIPLGVGVPTVRQRDIGFDLVVPLPAPDSWAVYELLTELLESPPGPGVTIFLSGSLRLYAERQDDGATYEFRYWNAGDQELPFKIDRSTMAALVDSVREAVFWLSVYAIGPDSEDDVLLREASAFVSQQPSPPIVAIDADPYVWRNLLRMCNGADEEAAAAFVGYHIK